MEQVGTVAGAVRWASVVTLLSAFYYLQLQVCARVWLYKQARRLRRSNQGFDTFNLSRINNRNNSNYEQTETVDLTHQTSVRTVRAMRMVVRPAQRSSLVIFDPCTLTPAIRPFWSKITA